MTNFENWKINKIVEDAVNDILANHTCETCPASKYCDECSDETCKGTLRLWLDEEAPNET